MTAFFNRMHIFKDGYLFGSRPATHGVFWLVYYVTFSLIWVKPESGLFASFYLEFLLLPARIFSVYCVVYFLLPRYLLASRFGMFILFYAGVLMIAASLQSAVAVYFYQNLLFDAERATFTLAEWVKNIMLINSTVVFVGALSILKRYLALLKSDQAQPPSTIEINADRRIHIIDVNNIAYIQGMGNYVEVHLLGGRKLTTYSSVKSMRERLPDYFLRVHRSYLINRNHLESFNANDVVIDGVTIPRGKDCEELLLQA